MRLHIAVCLLGAALGQAAVAAPIGPAAPSTWPKIVQGVDFNAVEWESLCPNVKPLTLTRGGGTCKKVHPASDIWQRYFDVSGRRPNAPPPNCEVQAQLFDDFTRPSPMGDKWGLCKGAFAHALERRGPGAPPVLKYDDMSFDAWRKLYFGQWLK